jgi:hypothetical protein
VTEAEKQKPPQKKAYEPPRILWEQRFIALAQVTQGPCIPGQDPRCTP